MTPRKHTKTAPDVSLSASTVATPSSPIVTPVATPSATSAPVATSQQVVVPSPPTVTLPSIPAGWSAVEAENYRGYHVRAAEVAALPNALTEVNASTSYEATFGPVGPSSTQFVETLQVAGDWSNARIQLESFLTYVKSEEMVAWKAGLTVMDQLNAVFRLAAEQNAEVAVQFPALARLFAVRTVTAKRAAATAKRRKAAKTAATTATSGAASTAATTPATAATVAPANGGAAH